MAVDGGVNEGKEPNVKKLILCGLYLVAFVAGGCVAQGQHDDLETLYRTSLEQNEELKNQLDQTNSQISAMRNAPKVPDPELVGQLAASQVQVDQLKQALDEAEVKIRELATSQTPLPPELNNELEQLAASDPALMNYDQHLGMVRLTSDLTFPLGSDQVSDTAVAGLQKLATILSTPHASKYEIRVVGHTDNVPIKNTDTKQKHPTNWHLSTHRSIAVKNVLESAGVTPVRLNVSGYGEYRPIQPNSDKGNRSNRRVEIYLVASSIPQNLASSTPPAAEPVGPPAVKVSDPIK